MATSSPESSNNFEHISIKLVYAFGVLIFKLLSNRTSISLEFDVLL